MSIFQETDIRRARVWDEANETWKYIKPFQTWEDGDVRPGLLLDGNTFQFQPQVYKLTTSGDTAGVVAAGAGALQL